MRFVVCCLFLAACGSSNSNRSNPPTEEELRNAQPDPSWTQTEFGIIGCDLYIGNMTECRNAAPEALHGMLDMGMKFQLAEMKRADTDIEPLCLELIEKAKTALVDICPDQEWGTP